MLLGGGQTVAGPPHVKHLPALYWQVGCGWTLGPGGEPTAQHTALGGHGHTPGASIKGSSQRMSTSQCDPPTPSQGPRSPGMKCPTVRVSEIMEECQVLPGHLLPLIPVSPQMQPNSLK